MRRLTTWGLRPALLLVLVMTCAAAAQTPDETAVRDTFFALQKAIKAKAPDQIWELLDADSQADANRVAKTLKASYARADEKGKAEQEKKLGLTAAELSGLTGRLFLKSNRFLISYIEEIPGSKFDRVTVKGDRATVYYTEDDGDKETLKLVREKSKWKVSLRPPKAAP
jgi:hypothetical protein